jgi:hypothetical protein
MSILQKSKLFIVSLLIALGVSFSSFVVAQTEPLTDFNIIPKAKNS